jgi:hypothetical protein
MPFVFILLGLSVAITTRTTLIPGFIQDVPNHFLTNYLYLSDFLVGMLLIKLITSIQFWKEIPRWFLVISIAGIWSVWVSPRALSSYIELLRFLGYALVFRELIVKSNMNQAHVFVRGLALGITTSSLLAIHQFVYQGAATIPLLLQPVLGVNIAGVAKINWFESVLVRASGTFPHPNILAYSVCLMIWVLLSSQIKPRNQTLWKYVGIGGMVVFASVDHFFITSVQGLMLFFSTLLVVFHPLEISIPSRLRFVGLNTFFLVLLLSFSRTGWLFAVSMLVAVLTQDRITEMFHVEHFKTRTFVVWASVISLVSTAFTVTLIFLPTAQKRVFYLVESLRILWQAGFKGVGLGEYANSLPGGLHYWQYQPVHSVPLLLIVEVGFGLVIAFVLWLVIKSIRPKVSL